MNLRTLSYFAFLAGGLVWVGRYFLGEDPPALYWVGLVMLVLALAAAGASLVKKGTGWLRLIVGIALPVLVGSLYSAIRPVGHELLVDGICGGVAVVVSVFVLARTPSSARQHHGSHAR